MCVCVCVCVTQLCPTLCNPMDYNLPGSSVHGWSGLPFPSPRDLPNPGIKPGSPALQSDSLLSESPGEWGAPTTGHQGSPDSSSFNFLKNHHTVFHSSPELFLIFALIHLTHKSSFLREEENRKEKARQWEPLSGYSLLLH